MKTFMKFASLIPMLLLCGCAFTGDTIQRATQPVTLYRQDRVDRVEKAVTTRDGKVVALLHGQVAGAAKPGPFAVTILQSDSEAAHGGTKEVTTVTRSSVAEGWPALEATAVLEVAAESVVLPGYQRAVKCPDKFPGVANAERTLYVVWNQHHDPNLDFVYVLDGASPNKTFFSLAAAAETRQHKYSLLLLLPAALVADVVMLPVWGVALLGGYRG
jgi:hypothetical protein